MIKVALVTGGSGQIGSAICKKFSDEGYAVVLTYNSDQARAEKLLSELRGERNSIVKASITDSKALEKLKVYVSDNYGRLDVLVNNAGVTTPVKHDDLDGLTDQWIDKIMQTNFRGSFAMVRAMKDLLQAAEGGSLVVNISSIAGIYAMGSNVAYCASKAALDSMTRSLARALAPQIRVVSVSPGLVEGEYTKSFDPNFLMSQKSNTPLGRFALGEDVANAVYAVATSLTFSTGNIITVDGGRLLK
ncbi:SDR family oxidoreductase [soil metagenome]